MHAKCPTTEAGVRQRRRARATILITWLAAIPRPGTAQVINFRHYTAADGMPQAQIMGLHQDRFGYLWFATYGGLSRFTGREFRTWTREDGLSSNSVFDVTEDAAGRLLTASSAGLCILDQGRFQCYRQSDGLGSDNARSVAADVAGGAWVATTQGLSLVHNGRVRTFTVANGLPSDRVGRVAVDAAGTVWAATDRGLARREGDRFVPEAGRLGTSPVAFVVAAGADLLAGTGNRLFEWRAGRWGEVAPGGIPRETVVVDAARDAEGTIWVATLTGALRIRGADVRRITQRNGLLSDLVTRVKVDREGVVWFGTESGASKHVPGPFSTYTVEEGLPNAFVRAIATDAGGRLWMGTRNGIALRKGDGFVPLDLGGIPEKRIYAIARAPDGGMLVGTRRGLVWHGDGTRRLYLAKDGLPGDWVYSLQADTGGVVWVGTDQGLARWHAGRVSPAAQAEITARAIMSMGLDAGGRLWLGRITGGITLVDGDSVTHLGEAQGVTDQTVWAIERDAHGRMWVGTNGDGALRFDDGKIRRYTMSDGLASNFVWQVLADSRGDLWFFGNLGLNRLSDDGLRHYGRGSGLIELEGSAGAAYEDEAGDLWFGTGSGVVRYVAGLDAAPAVAPHVYVEAVTHEGRPVAVAAPRTAGAGSDAARPDVAAEARLRRGTVRIQFSSPSFRDETAIRYRYRLVGASEIWSAPTEERSITYGGLGPGHYRFEARAAAGEVESDASAVFAFSVQPALWQTWWFRLLGALLVAGGAAAVPWLRARGLERERRRLEALVAQHTRELAEKNARLEASNRDLEHFAYVASHDLQEPLRKIQAFSDRVTRVYAERLDDTARDYLSRMTSAAARMQRLIDDLLSLSRVSTRRRPIQRLDLNALVQEVVGDLEFRIHATQGRVDVDRLPSIHGDPVQIRQIFQNLIGNALKFHRPGSPPVVRVSAQAQDAYCTEIHVEDNGIGFESKDAEKVFLPFQRLHTRTQYEGTGIGLTICQKIAERHGGTIRAESTPGEGSRFIVILPVNGPMGEQNVA